MKELAKTNSQDSLSKSADRLPGLINEEVQLKVIYSEELLRADSPYTIDFDVHAYTTFLVSRGFSEKQLESFKVALKKNPSGIYNTDSVGAYDNFNNTVELYVNQFWTAFMEDIALIKELAAQANPGSDEYSEGEFNLLRTKRLDLYLNEAPKERSIPFASKLIEKALVRSINETLIHETGHAVDFKFNKKLAIGGSLLKIFPAVVGGAYVIYDRFDSGFDPEFLQRLIWYGKVAIVLIAAGIWPQLMYDLYDPIENSARRFEDEYVDEFKNEPIIMIKLKEDVENSILEL